MPAMLSQIDPRQRAWFCAVAAALAAHAWLAWALIGPRIPTLAPQPAPRAAATVRLLAPALPLLALATPAAEPRPKTPRAAAAHATATGAPHKATPAPTSEPPPLPAGAPQIAPALVWRYVLIQGDQRGSARLEWKPAGNRYEVQLSRELDGKALPAWHSEGALSALTGVEPDRYAERQPTQSGLHDAQDTNFRRDEGVISDAGGTALQVPPSDISWWLQLAALVAADPERYQIGDEIVMPVAGLSGERASWRFIVRGREGQELPHAAAGATLHLEREAQGPYDARYEVWLDPSRHYLPIHVQASQGGELLWELLFDTDQPDAQDQGAAP